MVIVLSLQTIVDPLGTAFGRSLIAIEFTFYIYIEIGRVQPSNTLLVFQLFGNPSSDKFGILNSLRFMQFSNN